MTDQQLLNELDQESRAMLEALTPKEFSRWMLILKYHPWIQRYRQRIENLYPDC